MTLSYRKGMGVSTRPLPRKFKVAS
jgi:hypothetical protein